MTNVSRITGMPETMDREQALRLAEAILADLRSETPHRWVLSNHEVWQFAGSLHLGQAEIARLKEGGAHPFDRTAADRLADEVATLVRRRVLDARSPAGDALLDYRDPPTTDRADRMAEFERELEAVRGDVRMHRGEAHVDFEYRKRMCPSWDLDTPPAGDGWFRNIHRGADGWERVDDQDVMNWMRRRTNPEKQRIAELEAEIKRLSERLELVEEQEEATAERYRRVEDAVESLPPFEANDGDAYSIAPRILHAGMVIDRQRLLPDQAQALKGVLSMVRLHAPGRVLPERVEEMEAALCHVLKAAGHDDNVEPVSKRDTSVEEHW